ncbi:hypothetical protein BGL39_02745 [Fructilactobacillus sanfranciscensis]|uniref:hypothetical protein n=2 Tax=Fructilactobacillus sanfranciscensis TaxID=1625 RepID=UPI000CD3F55D|nr:hypothetical protein [Fructilactobacillus sanfranciscensis]POH09714.1 hypothetical protein BGL37_02840 [Fructilactobacillus sanfranciscensis]POH10490.1 hypothetical protein BGL39_02745 [Fructilactobacillus sanfranciscensis]POH14331.1 hypothetical protein BGL42_02840 [Fructilactobacillus sanfranciscensis]
MLVANVNDYFSTEIFKGVSSSLRKKGYTAVMLDSNNDLKNELEMLLLPLMYVPTLLAVSTDITQSWNVWGLDYMKVAPRSLLKFR